MHSLIALKFGTNKEHIKANSATKFGMNLISIQCVKSNDLCKNDWAVDWPTGLTTNGNSLKIALCIGELL